MPRDASKTTPLDRIDAAYAFDFAEPKGSRRAGPWKAVLVAVVRHADTEGRCWPRVDRLAAMTSLAERAVRDALDELERRGLVIRGKRRRRADGTLGVWERHVDLAALGVPAAKVSQPPAPDAGGPPAPGSITTGTERSQPPAPGAGHEGVELEEAKEEVLSPLSTSEQLLVAAGAKDDEARAIVKTLRTDTTIRSPIAYLRAIAKAGDLEEFIVERRKNHFRSPFDDRSNSHLDRLDPAAYTAAYLGYDESLPAASKTAPPSDTQGDSLADRRPLDPDVQCDDTWHHAKDGAVSRCDCPARQAG